MTPFLKKITKKVLTDWLFCGIVRKKKAYKGFVNSHHSLEMLKIQRQRN